MKPVTIWVRSGNRSCLKTKKWFEDHHIPYEIKQITSITVEELKYIQSRSYESIKTLFTHGKYQEDMQEWKTSKIFNYLVQNPTYIKVPIIINDKCVCFGFKEEEARSFINRKFREQEIILLHEEERNQ